MGHENKVAEQHLHIRDQAVGREQRKLEEHAAHLSWDVTDEMKPASQKYCVARISESGIRKTPELRVHMWLTHMFALASLALKSL